MKTKGECRQPGVFLTASGDKLGYIMLIHNKGGG
jgi:hypothetical protein